VCDWKVIIHHEVLPPGQMIDSNFYCQLERLWQAIKKRLELINKKSIVFHHDNARLHTSLAIRQKLKKFNWEVLMQSPYSPDHQIIISISTKLS